MKQRKQLKDVNPAWEALKDVGIFLGMAACLMGLGALFSLLVQDFARAVSA